MIPTGDNIFVPFCLVTIKSGLVWYIMKAYYRPDLFIYIYLYQPLVSDMVYATCSS